MSKVTIDRELLERVVEYYAEGDGDLGCIAQDCREALAQPAQQGDAVEVVGWRRLDRPYELTAYPSVCAIWHGVGYPVQALYTKPVASVPAGCKVVPVGLLERLAGNSCDPDCCIAYWRAELRALLASAEGEG